VSLQCLAPSPSPPKRRAAAPMDPLALKAAAPSPPLCPAMWWTATSPSAPAAWSWTWQSATEVSTESIVLVASCKLSAVLSLHLERGLKQLEAVLSLQLYAVRISPQL
jgi:hypothetical protein